VFEGFAGGGINDGVGSIECDIDVGNLCGKAGHVMLDDDVGLIVTAAGMMGMMGWEALASFSAVGATCTGTSLRPSCAGNTGVDGDGDPQEGRSAGGLFLCFCCTATALPWVDGGGNICDDGGYAAGDRGGPSEALWCWSAWWSDSGGECRHWDRGWHRWLDSCGSWHCGVIWRHPRKWCGACGR
jgi:hypothetical protein